MKLWKVELQKLADETFLTTNVRHYPPGTSKWNKIEHRLFYRITQNWRGQARPQRPANSIRCDGSNAMPLASPLSLPGTPSD